MSLPLIYVDEDGVVVEDFAGIAELTAEHLRYALRARHRIYQSDGRRQDVLVKLGTVRKVSLYGIEAIYRELAKAGIDADFTRKVAWAGVGVHDFAETFAVRFRAYVDLEIFEDEADARAWLSTT